MRLSAQMLDDSNLLPPARAVRTTKDALVVEGHRVTGAGLRRLLTVVNDDRHVCRRLEVRHTPWGDVRPDDCCPSPGLLPVESEELSGMTLRPRLLILDPHAADVTALTEVLQSWSGDVRPGDPDPEDYIGAEAWAPHPNNPTGPVLRLRLPTPDSAAVADWLDSLRAGRIDGTRSPVRRWPGQGVLSRVVRALLVHMPAAPGERLIGGQVGSRILTDLLGEVDGYRSWAAGRTDTVGRFTAQAGGAVLDGLTVTTSEIRAVVDVDEISMLSVPTRGVAPWPAADHLGYLPPAALLAGVDEGVLMERVLTYDQLRGAGLSRAEATDVLLPVLQPPAGAPERAG